MSEVNPISSSNESNEADVKEYKSEHSGEPSPKKPKLMLSEKDTSTMEKLENRLGSILRCVVCFDLPNTAIFQCINGHLMCAGCFNTLLADSRLRDVTAVCPNCRVEMSKATTYRNLAVEKAVSELPSECQFCGKEYPRHAIDRHEQSQCMERTTICQYSRIGCSWRGPYHEHEEHERSCTHLHNSGLTWTQVLNVLNAMEKEKNEEKNLYGIIFDLLSYEKFSFSDVQMKPYRTEEFIHTLYYETLRFTLCNYQWVIKAQVNDNQKDVHQSVERYLSYQVILKSKISSPLTVHYMILRGPCSDIKVDVKIHKFEFTENEIESPFQRLPLVDSTECNRLLASKTISFRIMMFLMPK